MSIPSKLRDPAINFCLVEKPTQGVSSSGKKPFQENWPRLNVKWDNKQLEIWLSKGGNYGVIGGGEKNLVVIDFDDKDLQEELLDKLPETFTVKTGGGLLHKYYFTDGGPSFKILDESARTLADIQSEGKQVVGPGSVHYSGNRYEIKKNIPIATMKFEDIRNLLIPFHTFKKGRIEPQQPKQFTGIDDFQEDLFNSVSLESLLHEFGVDTSHNPSNCPFHDSKGGKCLGWDEDTAHCFHCIHPDQDIFTIDGLKKAKDIVIGDITINALGKRVKFSKVNVHKNSPKNKMLKIIGKINKSPLRITSNHGMFYYKDVICDANYFRGHTLCKESCSRNCNKFKGKNWKITNKINAENITKSDALFFPIDKYEKDIQVLNLKPSIKEYKFGPKNKRIDELPLSNNMLWVIGMYLAAGNSFRGGIKFSLSREEEEYADRIIKAFEKINISGSKFYQTTPTGKSLIVTISKTDLEHSFRILFGRGCQNKKIPRLLLDLPPKKLKHLLRGVLDGDGACRDDTLGQTSKQLNMDCFEMALKTGLYPTTSNQFPNNKKPVYKLFPSKNQVARGIINNNYLSIVTDIKEEVYEGEVIDLTVEGNHPSLLTPQGIIGNCDGAWNKMSWIKENKDCDAKEAIEWLADREGRKEELEKSREDWKDHKIQEDIIAIKKTIQGAKEEDGVKEFKEKTINWTNEDISWEDMREDVRKIIIGTDKFFMVCSKKDEICGKPQLIHTTKKEITLVRKVEREKGKAGKEQIIHKIKFLDEGINKTTDGVIIDTWSEKFWTYRVISDNVEYYLLSKEELPLQGCIIKGMLMNVTDMAEMNQTLRIKSISNLFFVHSFEPSVKIVSKQEIVDWSKENNVTEEVWTNFLDLHPMGTMNRFPKNSNMIRSIQILSGKRDGYPLHLAVMGPAGTRKSMGYIETIAHKFAQYPQIIEGGNSRIKGLSPSFKEKPANIGYLARCERMGWVDELGKMIEFERTKHDIIQGNVLGELNFLLDHKRRTVGSGNDNDCVVQANSKFLFVTNPIQSKDTIGEHIGSMDPTTMSRIFWWVQNIAEQQFVISQNGVEKPKNMDFSKPLSFKKMGLGANAIKGSPPNTHIPRNLVNNITTKEKSSFYDGVSVGGCFLGGIPSEDNLSTDEFLTLFDTVNSFLCEIDDEKINELNKIVLGLANPHMKKIWEPRADHHIALLIDGTTKHRCLFKDYDASFEVKQEDYDMVQALLIDMVNRWETNMRLKGW